LKNIRKNIPQGMKIFLINIYGKITVFGKSPAKAGLFYLLYGNKYGEDITKVLNKKNLAFALVFSR